MTQTADPFDDLASRFLTSEGAHAGRTAPGASPEGSDGDPPTEPSVAAVELLLVGHLPVRAALWLTPYADAVARRMGTTALVRLDADEPTIQVIRGSDEPSRGPSADTSRNLREAILDLGPSVRSWIVRPSPRAAIGELLGRADAPTADRLTILSSADQVAVVNVYSLIKELADTASSTDRPVPPLGLVVVGANEDQAASAARGVDLTTREYLEIPVPLTFSLPRIDAAIRAGRLRSFPGQSGPPLEDVLRWITETRSKPVTPPVEARAPIETPIETMARREPEIALKEWLVAEPPRAAPAPTPIDTPTPRHQAPTGAPTAKLPPKVATELEPKGAVPAREPDHDGCPVPLANHVTDPVLTPLLPRCPGHERVELAVDPAGDLHLLAHEEELRSLPIVEAWARGNRELIAMACPQHPINPAGPLAHHVFTHEPVRVCDLQPTGLRLHVLAPVDVDGKRGWYAAPLNK